MYFHKNGYPLKAKKIIKPNINLLKKTKQFNKLFFNDFLD